MTKQLSFFFILILVAPRAWGAFSNYRSILVGEKAAGMGGAFTALSGDPTASAFYNPATLARMQGSSLSGTANVYHKYDTSFGDDGEFTKAPLRVNRGSIVPIPASSGTVYTLGHFALGLSIVFPDFDIFTGELQQTKKATSYLSLRDESLWVGGGLALNLTPRDAVGLTMYYTSRTFTRSVTDRLVQSGNTSLITEEKSFSHNSLLYQLGYWHEINNNWQVGGSWRFTSVPIAGRGSYSRSQVSTDTGAQPPVSQSRIKSQTVIPAKGSLGVAYEQPKNYTASFDVTYHTGASYKDMNDAQAGEKVRHKPTWNASVGFEHFAYSWLAWRYGFYTNLSSRPEIPNNPGRRRGDHLDMWGFSTNLAVYTSDQSSVTLGGYYTGGKGFSTQQVGQRVQKVKKSLQIFSFLVGTSFYF